MFKIDVDYRRFNTETLGLEEAQREENAILDDEVLQENKDLLYKAFRYWSSLSDWRERRKRSRNYLRGKQWSEKMTDPDCESQSITEEEHIRRQGLLPSKNNQVRQTVKNVVGQYRSNETKPIVVARTPESTKTGEMMTMAVRYVHQINIIDELDTRNMEEFLLSGMAVGKTTYSYNKSRNMEEVKVVNVNPNFMFFNTDIRDIRTEDLRMIGEMHDFTLDEVIGVFATTEIDRERIMRWYRNGGNDFEVVGKGLSSDALDSSSFFASANTGMCRVFEIWELRSEWRMRIYDPLTATYTTEKGVSYDDIANANSERIAKGVSQGVAEGKIPLIEGEKIYEPFWYVKYLTPDGHVLGEFETPYQHEEHPYSLLLYPLIDGEVWGFIEDIIDQQRYINRMVTLLDAGIGMGIKNLLLVPESAIPEGMDIDDYSEEWTKINGVIAYKPKAGVPPPQQLSASSTNMGAHDLLALQMRMLQDISGVNGAIQGQAPTSGTPSSLYAQQSQNASLNLLDTFETFNAFKQRRDTKILKVVKQYYREKRYLAISGNMYNKEANMYNPDDVRDIDFDLVLSQSVDTPAFKQLGDELLMRLFEMQAIPVEIFLENTSMPMAQNVLQAMNSYKEKMQQGEGGAGAMLSPEQLQEIEQNSNPEAMEMLNKMMQGK